MYRDPNEAWERICDTFRLNTPFSMKDAIKVGFPGVTSNNFSRYARKLRALFDEVFQRTKEEDEHGVPHVRCIRNYGATPSREMWELPSSKD